MSSQTADLDLARDFDKGGVKHVEEGKVGFPTEDEDKGLDSNHLPRYDDAETKKILRKVDYRLLPVLALLYLLSYLDRGNIGNAKVAGMNKDLGLTGKQYNLVLTVGNGIRAWWCLVLSLTHLNLSCFSYPTLYSRYPATWSSRP